jgi:hypothetical protein
VLGLQRLLPRSERGGDGVLEQLAVEQGLGDLSDRLLAACAQPIRIVEFRVDGCSLTSTSGPTEILRVRVPLTTHD